MTRSDNNLQFQSTNIQKTLFGILAGWGSQTLSLVIGFFTLPLFFRFMSNEELGIWMLFIGSSYILNIADIGISPVMVRQIAFALGRSDIKEVSDKNAAYYYSLARYASKLSSPVFFVFLFLCGYYFLSSLTISSPDLLRSIIYAWIVFSIAQTITYYYKYNEIVLNGHGEVGWTNITQVVVQLVSLIGFYVTLKFVTQGVFGLTLVFLFRNILASMILKYIVHRFISAPDRKPLRVHFGDIKPHLVPALDMFTISIGSVLIFNTSQYFIATMLGTSMLPDYLAASRLVGIVFTIAATASSMFMPYVSRLSAQRDESKVKKYLFFNVTMGMLIHLSGIAMIAVFADYIIALWLGKGHFLGWPIIWLFCTTMTLENHHTIFAKFGLSASVDPSWGKISLLSGMINLVLTYYGIKYFGLPGAALAVFVAQLLTSNWYAVWKTMQIIKVRIREYMKESAYYWMGYISILLCALYIVRKGIGDEHIVLALSLFISTALFASMSLYYLHCMKMSLRDMAANVLPGPILKMLARGSN